MIKGEIINDNIVLCEDDTGLSLVSGNLKYQGDYSKLLKRINKSNINSELLVKISKIRDKNTDLIAIDATAGMGEDSLLLAAAGFNVKLYENNEIIVMLLRDTIKRAKNIPQLKELVSRMEVMEGDSIDAMNTLKYEPDVVLLDPMFPKRTKSALIKKKFQLLHYLESPCSDEKKLLDAAINAHPKKIIIKRPLKGPFLANVKPSYFLKGKSIRYDCIVLN